MRPLRTLRFKRFAFCADISYTRFTSKLYHSTRPTKNKTDNLMVSRGMVTRFIDWTFFAKRVMIEKELGK